MTATTNNKPTTCEAHKGKRLKYWCDQDDTAVCTSCLLIGAHRGHKAVPIDEAAIKATTQARADVTLLEANLGRINEALAEVEARSDNARERAASSRIAVHKHFAWLKAVLAQREDELEKELRAWEDQRAHAMQQDHSKLSKVKQELEVACELMQAIVTHPSVNLLAASGEVSRRRATALKAREAASPHLLKPFGGRAKVCEESIAFQADECSARKAIHGAMLSIQSAGDKKEIEQDGDSSDYLELNVVVYRDLKLWHQADLWGPELIRKFKVKKNSTVKQFKAIAAEAFRIPEPRQRYWTCRLRRNRTIRPDEPFSAQQEECAFEELFPTILKGLTVFLDDSSASVDGRLPRSSEALLFFKYYDPEAEERLRFMCSLFVKIADPIQPEQELLLFEEIRPTMVKRLKDIKTTSFVQAELSNGDIVCVQRTPVPDRRQACNLAPALYARLALQVTVRFHDLHALGKEVCALKLSRTATYEEVVRELAAHLMHEPGKLRITEHSSFYNKPRMQPVKNTTKLLTDMLDSSYNSAADILYYENLDVPLVEFETNKQLKIEWFNDKVQPVAMHQVLVPKTALFSDVIAKLKGMVGPLSSTGQIRLLKVQNHRIYRLLQPDERIIGFTALRAEEVPEEDLKKDPKASRTIQVTHVYRDPHLVNFGNPFNIVVPKGERFADTKRRIQEKLAVPDEEFTTWKFLIVPSISKPVPVEDDKACIAAKFIQSAYLGLEHKPPPRSNAHHRKEEHLIIKG